MNSQSATNATLTKERRYAQLASSLSRLSQAVGHTADLFEALQVDLDAMRTLTGTHAAQFMTVAAQPELNPSPEGSVEGGREQR